MNGTIKTINQISEMTTEQLQSELRYLMDRGPRTNDAWGAQQRIAIRDELEKRISILGVAFGID